MVSSVTSTFVISGRKPGAKRVEGPADCASDEAAWRSLTTQPCERYQPHWVDSVLAVPRAPVEVRTGHPSRRPYEADLLATLYGIADRHECLRQMEVSRDDSAAVVDVHDVPR